MKKTFNFGRINYNGTGRRYPVNVTIELSEKNGGKVVFSAHGNIGACCGGQCLDAMYPFLFQNETFLKVYRFWKLYHLNDMHAGTEEQEKAIDEWKALGNKYDYAKVCDYLKSVGLYEVDLNGTPYKYGHSWLYREIPAEDLEAIKALFA